MSTNEQKKKQKNNIPKKKRINKAITAPQLPKKKGNTVSKMRISNNQQAINACKIDSTKYYKASLLYPSQFPLARVPGTTVSSVPFLKRTNFQLVTQNVAGAAVGIFYNPKFILSSADASNGTFFYATKIDDVNAFTGNNFGDLPFFKVSNPFAGVFPSNVYNAYRVVSCSVKATVLSQTLNLGGMIYACLANNVKCAPEQISAASITGVGANINSSKISTQKNFKKFSISNYSEVTVTWVPNDVNDYQTIDKDLLSKGDASDSTILMTIVPQAPQTTIEFEIVLNVELLPIAGGLLAGIDSISTNQTDPIRIWSEILRMKNMPFIRGTGRGGDIAYNNIKASIRNSNWKEESYSDIKIRAPSLINMPLYNEYDRYVRKMDQYKRSIMDYGHFQEHYNEEVEKATPQYHFPGMNYMGPGTHVLQNIGNNIEPTDIIDEIALEHDMDYLNAHGVPEALNKADDDAIAKVPYISLNPLNQMKGIFMTEGLITNKILRKIGVDFGESTRH